MNLVFSILTTGPDPAVHEVLQIGAAIFDHKFIEKKSQFGAFIRPERPAEADKHYLRSAGFQSLDHLKDRMPYHEPFSQVWLEFQGWCLRYAPYDTFGDFCEEVAWVGHRLHEDLWFLTEVCRRTGEGNPPFSMRKIRSYCDLSSTIYAYESVSQYLGVGRSIGRDLDSIAQFFGVSLKDKEDPTKRAVAIGRIYHKHMQNQKEVFEKAR